MSLIKFVGEGVSFLPLLDIRIAADFVEWNPSLSMHGIEDIDGISINPNDPQGVGAEFLAQILKRAMQSFAERLQQYRTRDRN